MVQETFGGNAAAGVFSRVNQRFTNTAPATQIAIGIRKALDTRVSSSINTSAVSGIFCDTAKKAAAPTSAAASKESGGRK